MDKVVIVTGASKGIGRNIAKTLAEKGYKVVANYNKSKNEALELQQELAEKNIEIDIFCADVSKRSNVKELIEFTIEKYKKIDCIVNNAGIDEMKMFIDITDSDWKHMMDNNLNSVFYTCQEVLPYMIDRKEGSIINISSIWGEIGASCESHYAVAKAGINALTKSLAKEMGPSNIRVNSIAPGFINTDMNNNLTDEEKQEIINEIPLEKIGKVQDISKCVEWLIEDDYVTGQIISINGGWNI